MVRTVSEHEQAMRLMIHAIDGGELIVAAESLIGVAAIREAIFYGVACIQVQRETNATLQRTNAQLLQRPDEAELLAKIRQHKELAEEAALRTQRLEGELTRLRGLRDLLAERNRALSSGAAMRDLIQAVAVLTEQNEAMRAQLEAADRGERLRNKRESEATKRAAPQATLEGYTYGSPAIHRRQTLTEGAYRVLPARQLA